MEKRNISKLGVTTSLLGFGCMRFPTTATGEIDEALATKMLDMAYEAGVNYYDTAYPYHGGESEPFLGRWLDTKERSTYYLATKLPVWEIHSLDDAKAMFEKQLVRLNKDYVDFYLLHALNKERFDAMVELGVVDYFAGLKKTGVIRNYGFSFHDSYEAFEKIITYRDWDFCQIQYNYMDVDEQAGDRGYALAEKLNVPLVIMEPIKGGSLSKLPEEVRDILVDKDKSDSSYALRFVASRPNVMVVLSGMSNLSHVEDNLATFENFVPFSEEEERMIATLRDMMRRRVKNGCTACRYCMPCPAGVDIPGNFRIWNQANVYNNRGVVAWDYDSIKENHGFADVCVKCGLCETKCPQKLSIRDDLVKVTEYFA